MKNLYIIFLMLICNAVFSSEARYCEGTQKERLAGLKELGKTSLKFKVQYGYIPNLEEESNAEYEKSIPKNIRNYIISSNSEANSIQYSCDVTVLNSVEDSYLEICVLALSTGKVSCSKFGFKRDKES